MAMSAGTVKAIETRYAGYRFRSRLEARWAVFFSSLGVQWEYEPEGFDLKGDWYLPDFRVKTGDLVYWYEVKPRDTEHCAKFSRFRKLITGSNDDGGWHGAFNIEARLLSGDPFDVFFLKGLCPRCGREVVREQLDVCGDEYGFLCHPCDLVTASGGGNPHEIGFAGTSFYPHKGWIMVRKQDYLSMMRRLGIACRAARGARFEHGAVVL
jgi:hypothetical protein